MRYIVILASIVSVLFSSIVFASSGGSAKSPFAQNEQFQQKKVILWEAADADKANDLGERNRQEQPTEDEKTSHVLIPQNSSSDEKGSVAKEKYNVITNRNGRQ